MTVVQSHWSTAFHLRGAQARFAKCSPLPVPAGNKLLQPLFREIKSQIRHMSFNPEFELMKEYLSKRTQLERAIEGTKSPEERKAVLGKLKKMYAAILAKR